VATPQHQLPLPPDFLKTVESITKFATLLQKIKAGVVSDAVTELDREECQTLIWGLQLLKEGRGRG
jgi:hypothetical protein